jgi:hypothetical protein
MSQSAFRFNPLQFNRTFGATYTFGNNGAQQTISYEISVKCLGKLPGQLFLLEINKGQVYINDHEPDQLIDRLSDVCGKVLYPLQITVNEAGLFKGVANQVRIAAAWEAARPGLQQYYTGSITADMLAYMDLAVASEAHIYQSLCRDWFMALCFADIYQPGGDIMERQFTTALPIVPYTVPVQFAVTQKPVQHHTDSGCLVLQHKAQCTDPRSLEDLLGEKEIPLSQQLYGIHTPLKATAELTYKLYHSDWSLNAITGFCILPLEEEQTRRVDIAIYHLREKDQAPVSTTPAIVVEQEAATEKEKKKGFFSSLFQRNKNNSYE